MQNTAVYAPITFEEIVMVMINIPNRTFLVGFGGISGEFGRAMVRILARPNKPDMLPKPTKKVRFGIYRTQIQPKIANS